MSSLHSMSRACSGGIAGLLACASILGCGATPTTRAVANTDVTTQTSSGGQSRTTVRETSELGANGSQNTERTETVRTSTPAPTPPRQ